MAAAAKSILNFAEISFFFPALAAEFAMVVLRRRDGRPAAALGPRRVSVWKPQPALKAAERSSNVVSYRKAVTRGQLRGSLCCFPSRGGKREKERGSAAFCHPRDRSASGYVVRKGICVSKSRDFGVEPAQFHVLGATSALRSTRGSGNHGTRGTGRYPLTPSPALCSLTPQKPGASPVGSWWGEKKEGKKKKKATFWF